MPDLLTITQTARIRRLTLNRPDLRNALNLELCQQLLSALHDADADPTVGAILLDGAGKAFCSGMDLKEVLEVDPDVLLPVHRELFSIGTRLRTPTISAVHGAAIAGGLGLALNAHWLISAEGAKFGATEVRIGLWPYAIFDSLTRALGERRAIQLALKAEVFDATQALAIGLVDEVVPADQLNDHCTQLANRLASQSADAIRLGLEFVPKLRSGDPNAVVDGRRSSQASPDYREGITAFREKRKPNWPSHHG